MAKGKPKSKIVCPACESIRSESHGARETKSLGLRQRRRCLECGYKFTIPHDRAGKVKKKKKKKRGTM